MTSAQAVDAVCLCADEAGSAERVRHSAYWPQDILQKGFKKMELFRSVIRINAGDRSQAYASLPGLSADMFIRVRPSQSCYMLLQTARQDLLIHDGL